MKDVRGLQINHLIFLSIVFVFAFLQTSSAFAGPNRTTYQAKIVKPDGYPLEAATVNFKFTILDPAGSCILYSETYSSVNMSGTGGLISFALGSGVKTYPTSATTTFEEVFSNITPSLTCDAGGPATYSPGASDARKIVMQFHDGNGWQTLPAMSINAVPYAMYANSAQNLNGKTDADFVQVASLATCGVGEALHYNGVGFSCVTIPAPETVSGAAVVSALGYTPANSATVNALSSSLSSTDNNVASVSSTVASVSSTVFSVSSTVSSLSNTVSNLSTSVSNLSASMAAVVSSQWVTSGTSISYSLGNVNVSGAIRIGMDSTSCAASLAGTLRYNSGTVEYCNGASWLPFGVAGAGITNINGSTSGSQTFATGITGTVFNISSANGVHTFNIPLAASGSVTAGLLSNADYLTFTNKLNATSAAVISALGYTPLDSSVSGTYAVKSNNLSDLASATVARANLGLGSLATLNYLDLSSAQASGTLSVARLPAFSGDASSSAGSAVLTLASVGAGVTSGTQYTKVTVDGKGRVVSGAQLSSSDVTTALGYTPGAATSGVTSLNGSTSQTQIFANGTSGNAPAFNTAAGVHTLNIPLASATGSVTAGLISNADYVNFSNKITSSAASIAQVLGYVPASATALGNYAVRTNNLADLASATVARTNLGLGSLATLNFLDLGTSYASGTLSVARLPAFSGDASSSAGSAVLTLASVGAGVTSGTQYTKVTVDGKGRVVSGAQLSSSDVTTALGYTPANNAASGTYAQKANNLSDLASATVARTNLGVGYIGTLASVDLSSSDVTGTLAIARTPAYTGDVTKAAASNTLVLSNTGVTAGTYTKVTVDAKGRVTSSSALTASDVNTALGYTAANSATVSALSSTVASMTSSQWTTSGSAIFYNSGNTGLGTSSPNAQLHLGGGISSNGQLKIETNTSNSTLGIDFWHSGGGRKGFVGMRSSGSTAPTPANFSLYLWSDQFGGPIIFGTQSVERMRLDSVGNLGVGVSAPVTRLDVSGGLKISMESATCAASFAGTLRYNAGNVEYCNGSAWTAFGAATVGVNTLNGSASQTQTFANGSSGNAPAFSTSNGVHTLNIPLASATGSVTAGLISNADYLTFTNKLNATSAAVISALGYTPASATALSNYVVRANNLSDLTSSATARTNLGLGTFATANTIDLGSASATGTLATARLPAMAGDASSTVGSNSLTVVGLQGRSVVATAPTTNQVLAYNGSAWAPATNVSSQWTTSGTSIYYNGGNVGVGTAAPAQKAHVHSATTSGTYQQFSNNESGATINDGFHVGVGDLEEAIIMNRENTPMRFFTNNTERMNIGSSGNVGIGVASSNYSLQVSGVAHLDSVRVGFSAGTNFLMNYTSVSTLSSGSWGWNLRDNFNNVDKIFVERQSDGGDIIFGGGNVGIGTNTPATALDVSGTLSALKITGTLMSIDNRAVSDTPETASSAGMLLNFKNNSTNGLNDGGIYNGVMTFRPYGNTTDWTGGPSHQIGFTTNGNLFHRYGSSTTWNTWRRIIETDASGRVGIGTSAPSVELEVSGTVKAAAYLYTSDRRLKKDIVTLPDALTKALQLRGVNFVWRNNEEKTVGFIAQEVEAVYPELVKTDKQSGFKAVQYGNIVAILVEALKQENKERIEAQNRCEAQVSQVQRAVASVDEKSSTRMNQLEKENKELKERLDRLEKLLLKK